MTQIPQPGVDPVRQTHPLAPVGRREARGRKHGATEGFAGQSQTDAVDGVEMRNGKNEKFGWEGEDGGVDRRRVGDEGDLGGLDQ